MKTVNKKLWYVLFQSNESGAWYNGIQCLNETVIAPSTGTLPQFFATKAEMLPLIDKKYYSCFKVVIKNITAEISKNFMPARA